MQINPVKGTHDIYGQDSFIYHEIENSARLVAEIFNYEEIRTPIIEHTNLFIRSVGESSDIVNKEMYTFDDKGGRSMTLRPEMTAGVMRSVVSNKLYVNADLPLKYYYCGPCFRYERPQAGRYRQFHQFGIETIGVSSPHQDAEVIAFGHKVLSAIRLPGIRVLINFLGDENSRTKYKEALKKYFSSKIDSMCEDCKRRFEINPLRILDCKVPEDIEIIKGAPKLRDFLSEDSRAYFDIIINDLQTIGIDVEIDDNLVRGLDYYTGVVFEYHISPNEEIKDVGALGGGGHYAKLLSDIGGPDFEGVGLAFGLERLATIFSEVHLDDYFGIGPDFYLIGMNDECISHCFKLADLIRNEGMSCEVCYLNKSIKSTFKTASKLSSKFAIVIGDDELTNNTITVKNLYSGEQTSISYDDISFVLRDMLKDYMTTIFDNVQNKKEGD